MAGTYAFGGTNLQKGAQGDTVKKIQEALNNHGYNLTVDGIWGNNTDSAIREYQQKNGLTVDGIYGINTHNSLFGVGGSNTSNKSYSDIDLSKYDSGYQKSDDVINAEMNKTNAENAVNNYGDFAYSKDATFDEIMNKILNREQFSYDLNGDALYQQYKDKYIQQGKMAMQDTMGQAAAMTGGYGNSYASTAGNQAYQASLENLNDIVPELYQMAYDKYNQEGQDLYNQYGMLSDDKSMEYGMWADKLNQLIADRGYYGTEANNALTYDYGKWSGQRDFDTNQYWNETEMGYAIDEANKGYARQDAYAMLQVGIMPTDEVLNAAGISKADAQSIANAYKSGDDEIINAIKNNPDAKIKIDESTGKPVVVDDPKSNIPQNVIDTLKGLKTNQQKEDYLWGLVEDKTITEEEMNELYAEYRNTTADLDTRAWTMESDGGWNLFGVDKNAKVKDQYGNTYTLDDLVDALIDVGMDKKKAKEYVINLQRELGIDTKWNPFK